MAGKIESHIRSNSWVKDLRRTFRPELLAGLIEKRLLDPGTVGPHYWDNGKDCPYDIIVALCDDEEEFKEKITPAVGLLLFQIVHDKLKCTDKFVQGIFGLIKDADLVACSEITFAWLRDHKEYISSKSESERKTYRDALLCFARIQRRNDRDITDFWTSIWNDENIEGEYWWPTSFVGLSRQSPEVACEQLPLFAMRKLSKSQHVLTGMWSDLGCRFHFVDALKNGLINTSGWAGLTINEVYKVLPDLD